MFSKYKYTGNWAMATDGIEDWRALGTQHVWQIQVSLQPQDFQISLLIFIFIQRKMHE